MNDKSTRVEHLAWAKARALEYVDSGDTRRAFDSMVSDLCKHDELVGHAAIDWGLMLLLGGHLASEVQMRKFIEGFN